MSKVPESKSTNTVFMMMSSRFIQLAKGFRKPSFDISARKEERRMDGLIFD